MVLNFFQKSVDLKNFPRARSAKMQKVIEIFANRNALATELGLPRHVVYRAIRNGAVQPDGQTLTGAPLFRFTPTRLLAIREQLLSTENIVA